MRKVIVSLVLLTLLLVAMTPYGCTNKKPESADTLHADTLIADTSANDSTENVIAETPMPKAADELFDDFVFNFAANRRLQRRRIVFPLPVYRNGKLEKKIEERNWKMEHFFMRQEYYTLICDNQKQREMGKDTTIAHVVVEKIFFNLKTVQQFIFNRINGEWMMTSINYMPMHENRNASFLKFYQHFAADTAFQMRSMADEVEFTAPDPEDDFSNISGVIVPQQWPDFKPGLIPDGVIYNVVYGHSESRSKRKIFVIRGIANGLEMEMDFKIIGGSWKLVRFNS